MAVLATVIMSLNDEFKFFRVNEKQVIRVAILDFRIANLKLLRKLVSSVLWESDFQGLKIHECWSIFKSNLLEAQEQANHTMPKVKREGQKSSLAEQGTPLGTHKEKNDGCKRGQASQDDYRAVVPMCRGKTQKSKAQS